LTPAEAQYAQKLHAEQEALNAKWEALRIELVREHMEATPAQTSGCVVQKMLVLIQWGCGEFTYSSDYKFVVPVAHPSVQPYGYSAYYELVNGVATPILEKPEMEDDGKWVWNYTRNSESNPGDAHKYKEPQR
jgi:hypothetical protein